MNFEIRFPIFDRDDYRCYLCNNKVKPGSKRNRKGFRLATLDHYIPRSLGGSDDAENLRTCCDKCNTKKGNMLPVDIFLSYHLLLKLLKK